MATLALNIRMLGKNAVIIGGGAVALGKIRTLLRAGAAVIVVAVTISPEITAMNDAGLIVVRRRRYDVSDMEYAFLVVAATDNALVNEQVRTDACERGILTAIVDNPATGDCTFPAVLQRGDLEVTVSTGGRCPTFAVAVRDYIAECVGSEYGEILDQLAVEREKLLTNGSHSTYNAQVLRSLASRLLAELPERTEPTP